MRPSLLLLAAVLAAPALAAPSPAVDAFAKTHSGAAAGNTTLARASGGSPGKETQLGPLRAYVVAPPGTKHTGAVLIFTDVFGFGTAAIRSWADRLAAKTGLVVAVPDFFKGNPRKASEPRSSLPAWLEQFPRATVLNETAGVIAALRKQHPDVKKIGVQGFCWGGLYAVLLAQGKQPTSAASVVYHGSLITAADVAAVNAPILLEQSDPKLDQQIGPELYKQIEAVLATKRSAGLDARIKNYAGMPHGYTLRGAGPNSTYANTAAATAAFDAGAAFLSKHLK